MAHAIPSRQRRPLYALYTASFVSVTGEALASIAIPWFVLSTTGSPARMGVAAFTAVAPVAIATFFGGTLVDRIGYKRVSTAADLASGLTIAMVPLLHRTVGLQFWQLLVLVFLTNLLDAPGMTARSALLPELAAQARIPLERAAAWEDGVSRATRMIGAPVAGALIAILGPVNVLWLDAVSFFVSALLITFFIRPVLDRDKDPQQASYFEDLRAGLSFIRRDRVIVTIMFAVMFTNLLDAGFGSVFMPVFSEQVYGPERGSIQLGLILGVFGGGALLGTLLMGAYGGRFPRRWLLAGGFGIIALRWFLFAAVPPLWLLLVSLGALSLAVGPLNPVISTVLYERTPRDLRARVLGSVRAGAWVAMPMGGLLAGYLLQWMSLRPALTIFGVAYACVALYLAVSPTLRTLNQQGHD